MTSPPPPSTDAAGSLAPGERSSAADTPPERQVAELQAAGADAAREPSASDTPSDAAAAMLPADSTVAPAPSPAACAARLAELFPALFGGSPRPIKLRIQTDIQQRAPGLFTRRLLSAVLARHTTTTGYLKALVEQGQRYDLDGQPAGEVSAEHRQAAIDELARRRHIVEQRRAAERAARQRQRTPPTADHGRRPAPSSGPRLVDAAADSGQPGRRHARRLERPARAPRAGTPAAALDASAAAVGHARKEARRDAPAEAFRGSGDPAQRERAQLLRAWEGTSLSKANFCALKRLSEADFDEQIERARRERAALRGS